MIFLQIEESTFTEEGLPPLDGALGERAAAETLRHAGIPLESDLTLVLTDDAKIQALNREYLGIDAPTDVLSFPSGGEVDPDSEHTYLGDVVLSYPRLWEQAAAAGHSTECEFQLLVVHGVLHLLGYDHAEPEEKNRMWAAQTQILHSLDCNITRLPE